MAHYCPKCLAPLPSGKFREYREDKLYTCPSCGAGLRITVAVGFSPPGLFWFLPPILDVIFLLVADTNKYVVSLASEPTSTFQPPPERIAFETTRKSAEEGDAEAQFKMGREHEEGHWVKNNDAEAFAWYRRAAEHGHADAQCSLGRMYFTGHGIKRNFEESYFWYSLGAKSGKPKEWPDALRRYLSAGQIATIERRVNEWKPTGSANST